MKKPQSQSNLSAVPSLQSQPQPQPFLSTVPSFSTISPEVDYETFLKSLSQYLETSRPSDTGEQNTGQDF